MKHSFKKIIAFILCFSIISSLFVRPVKADGIIWDTLLSEYKAMKELSQWTLYDVFDMLHLGTFGLIPAPSDAIKDKFGSYYDAEVAEKNNVDVSNVTDSMRLNYLHNAFTINDNSIVISDSFKNVIKSWQNDVVESNKYYVGYSLDLQYYSIPDSCYEFVNEYQGSYDVWCYTKYIGTSAGHRYYFYAYPKQDYGEVLLTVNSDDTFSYKLVNYNNFANFAPNTYNQSIAPAWAGYVQEKTSGGIDANTIYDITTSSWVNNNNSFKLMQRNYTYRVDDYPLPTQSNNGFALGWVNVTYKTVKAYTIMGTQALFESSQRGEAPYYYNNNVYSNWSNSTGDYTVTYDNSNRITFDDITAHIGDIYGQTGVYPTIPDIEHWIETQPVPTPLPTPTPTGTPSQGGNGTVVNNNNPNINNNPTFNNNPNINITLFPSTSGNGINGGSVSGNGGSGSIGNIFDWLGNLGNVIASLVKNVGEMIVNALEGVVEAVTTILRSIPNILSPIIEFVFGGLPEEVQALITLGITCIIFVGIIKVLKR